MLRELGLQTSMNFKLLHKSRYRQEDTRSAQFLHTTTKYIPTETHLINVFIEELGEVFCRLAGKAKLSAIL